jgi:hypothetical protein
MSAQQTFIERPFVATEPDFELESDPFETPAEKRAEWNFTPADKETVKARKYTSELVGILAATLEKTKPKMPDGSDFPFEDEALRMYLTLIELARRAEVQAKQNGTEPGELRRFYCPDYVAELTYRREILPFELSKPERREEKKKIEQKLGRAWRERFKRVIHERQCRNHFNFFEREKRESRSKRLATTYTDRLTDFLNFSLKLMRDEMKRGVPVKRAALAVEKSLREFIARPEHVYAPDWTEPETASEPTPETTDDAATETETNPFVSIERKLKRCVRATRELADERALSEDEKEIVRAKLHELIETEWTDTPAPVGAPRPRRSFSPPPVLSKDNISEKPAEWLSEIVRPPVVSAAPAPDLVGRCTTYLNSDEMQNCSGNLALAPKVLYEKCTSPSDNAQRTIEAMRSVGADRFKVVFLGCVPVGGQAECAGSEEVQADMLSARVAGYVERSERLSQSVTLRAWGGALIQVDDCTRDVLTRLLPFAFLAVETSPDNFQAWLALPPDMADDARKDVRERLLRKFKDAGEGANGGAYNSLRLPGCFNAKEKYRQALGAYPRVQLIHAAPGHIVPPLELERAGLLAAPKEKPKAPLTLPVNTKLPGAWPSYEQHLAEKGGDRSRADISYSMACIGAGFPRHAVIAQLDSLSGKAKGRHDDYAAKTFDNAARFVAESNQTNSGREQATI